ncbi:MAG: tRNA (adenosine(37)-N6)-threonylcarbamoyltransferase complex transferase subunit TsaD [Deltaproteobacteria bacterium]|nr:tRNA (adenosine(37)-N6)-threonylcarbamoyltransferase complex transferase subunit TsaD [Deltaproteobacteria bacterium]
MRVLGLESSCDETACAVVEDARWVCADVISSQTAVHARWGGVVPELASRAHVKNLIPVVEAALREAGVTLDDIDGIAVTRGPGLVGALLVALQAAKAIAWARQLPLVGVSHLAGHLEAIYLDDKSNAEAASRRLPEVPHLALLVSGGHTLLVEVRARGVYRVLGGTRDDAAGEAFDKVGKLMGLGYPAGPIVDKLARSGDPAAFSFPRALPGRDDLDFSFSGLKTAVLHKVPRGTPPPAGQALADMCAAFQAAVVEQLVRKTRAAARAHGLGEVVIGGGVAANSGLRAALAEAALEDGFVLHVPAFKRCTDNAAMIAAAGTHGLLRGEHAGLDLAADPSLAL